MPLSMTATFTPRPVLPPQAHSGVRFSSASIGGTCRSASERKGAEYAGCGGLIAADSHFPRLGTRPNVGGEAAQDARTGLDLLVTRLADLVHHLRQLEGPSEPWFSLDTADELRYLCRLAGLVLRRRDLEQQRRQITACTRLLDGDCRQLGEQSEEFHVGAVECVGAVFVHQLEDADDLVGKDQRH